MTELKTLDPFEVLRDARRVADLARADGFSGPQPTKRVTSSHLGAVLADAILQAGLRYSTVVRPRIIRILECYPETANCHGLMEVVRAGKTAEFLDWKHSLKVVRLEQLVFFVHERCISDTVQLRHKLSEKEFSDNLQELSGVGPKTVDYLACLVGVDSIAVDRHVRTYALRAGVNDTDYAYLKRTFCFAADLLEISRREFDAWVWTRQSTASSSQMSLAFGS